MIKPLLILCATVWCQVASAEDGPASLYLYQHRHAKPVLEVTDPDDSFLQSDQPRIVEFYSPHCPACVHFFPQYVELAKAVQLAYPEVEFYAVSCDAHNDLCQQFEIDGTPSIFAFPAESGEDGTHVEPNEDDSEEPYDVATLAQALDLSPHTIVRFKNSKLTNIAPRELEGGESDDGEGDGDVSDDGEGEGGSEASDDDNGDDDQASTEDPQSGQYFPNLDFPGVPPPPARYNGGNRSPGYLPLPGHQGPPPNFPQRRHGAGHSLARLKTKNLDRFQEHMKSKREAYVKARSGVGKFLRGDNRKDSRGRMKQRLDPEDMTPGMKAATAGYEENKQKMNRIKMRTVKAHKKMKMPIQAQETLKPRKGKLFYKKDVRKTNVAKRIISQVPVVGRRFQLTQEEEVILDVSLSFVTSLQSAIFMGRKQLSLEESQALRDFLDLLNISLPPEWGIHDLIDKLRNRFAFVTQSEDNLSAVLREHPLPRQTWSSSCVSKSKELQGFSCGFWKLLHVATMGVAEQRGGLTLVDSEMVGADTKTFAPIEAADAIRNYMAHFYSCKPCSENFIETYDDCEMNRRCDRLTEDEELATTADWKELPIWLWEVHNEVSLRLLKNSQAKFAARGLTTADSQIAAIWPNMDTCFMCFQDDGSWDEAEVFKHLENSYWPDADLDTNSDRLIQYTGDDGVALGVVLWILMFAILGGVYMLLGKTSPALVGPGMLHARRMVAIGPGKKTRTN